MTGLVPGWYMWAGEQCGSCCGKDFSGPHCVRASQLCTCPSNTAAPVTGRREMVRTSVWLLEEFKAWYFQKYLKSFKESCVSNRDRALSLEELRVPEIWGEKRCV